jgi:hypothetical protein
MVAAFSKATLLSWVLILLAPATTAAIELRDDPGGYEGLKWKAPPEEIPGLELVQDKGELKVYKMPGPPPPIAGMAVESLWYRFYKGRFESVEVRYTGKETHEKIRAWALERFGPLPKGEFRFMQEFTWVGPETTVLLQFDLAKKRGTLFVTSRALQAELGATVPLE